MKKITLLLACIVAFSGVINAQDSRSIAEVPNTTNNPVYSQGDPVTTTATVLFEKPMGAQDYSSFVSTNGHTVTSTHGPAIVTGQRGAMAVTPYTDRATFQAAYTGTLISEDFAGGPGAGAITPCGPVVSSSGDGCFPAGELVDGFNITVSGAGNDVIYIGSGAIGNASTLMGADTFADFTILTFAPDGAYAVGVDLFVDGVSNADVRIYDMGGGLLDTFVVTNTPSTENFFGVISDDAIGRIEIQAEADAGELFGNMEFGIDPIGGSGGACDEENPNDGTFENGFNCSSASAFQTANDVTVAADENFTLENITASIFANGGISNVDVNYYDDAAGLPGSLIGSEASVTIDNQAVIGSNFGFDVNEVEMTVAPFVFNGQAGMPTTYWIELSVTDGGATGSVFWVVTSSTAVGNPSAQFDAGWGIPDPLMDGVYIWEGDCTPIGGSGGACDEENPNDGTFENGFNCSSASAFQTANDVTVAADENFTLENITASIFANGGISNVDVNYYDDAAGLPGSLIGSEASVTIDNQAVIGSNFGFDVNEVEMTVTPFTFNGQAGMPTTYWIELSVTDGGATGSVFWVVTSSTAVGNPSAQFDAAWGIPDPLMDGVYIWSGTCDSLGVSDNALAGFSYYPNPATEVLSLRSANNIESVSMYNLLGQQVISTEIGATTSDINLSSLTAGTYIMKVTVDGQTGTYKVLKN